MVDTINEYKLKNLRNFLNRKYGVFIDDDKLLNVYKKKFLNLMKKLNYDSFDKFYYDIVYSKNTNLQEHITHIITVNETYFFREHHQFETLINYVLPEIDKSKPIDKSINILVAPCSTGEESYSVAIYLLEEGNLIHKRDFMLLGIDIDIYAINKAKKGIFSKRSIHKIPSSILKKYFKKVSNHYEINDFLKKSVNYKVVNILDEEKMKSLGKFDVIFSRNMLIYFDDRNRIKTLSIFSEILNDNGYLFLGHAEKVPSNVKFFKPIRKGNTYFYKKSM